MKRVSFGVILILSAFIFPWWVSFLLSILGLFHFENLYEVIVVGIIIDSLYGTGISIYGFDMIFTLTLAVLMYLIINLKKQILV